MAAKKTATPAATVKAEVKKPVAAPAKAEVKKPVAAPAKAEVKKPVAAPVKTEEKKAAPAKAVAKKAPAKKTTAKKTAVTAQINVQFGGKSYSTEDLMKIVKDVWKYDLKQKAADLKEVELYVKPEENMAYYVINKEITGSFFI